MSACRIALRLLIPLVFGGWIFMWVMRPTSSFTQFWKPFTDRISTKAYGIAGAFTLFYSAPVLFLAVVGAIYLHSNKGSHLNKKYKGLKPWTYPVLVRGPLAVVSAAELLILVLFVGLLVWTLSEYLYVKFGLITPKVLRKEHLKLWQRKLEITGTNLGLTGMICLAFLFFPIARGSVFLRLLNIPFEHAVKYHIWIGHIMMVIWTVHGLVFVIFWAVTGKMKELVHWSKTEISGLSGLLVWSVGVIMWITSLGPVRKKKFEVFYYTHHLYFLFILGFALHVGDRLYNVILGGVLLFFLNRFMRFLQSRKQIDVLSARMMSSETMELTIAKHPSLEYHPASFVLVNFPVLSPLQWHPFTIVSSSKADREHLSLLIKCNGEWTLQLKEYLERFDAGSPFNLEAGVEGPYGHNIDYMFLYDVLIFVAGGSGISPFISILKEMLHSNDAIAPKEVVLLWAVKKADELSILQLINPNSTCSENFKIDIQAYVTREQGVDLEMMSFQTSTKSTENVLNATKGEPCISNLLKGPRPRFQAGRAVSEAEGIQNGILHAALVISSFAGFLFVLGFIGRFYIYPIDHNTSEVIPRSLAGLFGYIATILGVTVFGGATFMLWNRLVPKEECNGDDKLGTGLTAVESNRTLAPSRIHYGNRPDLHDVFSGYAKRFEGLNVGVFACGPRNMQWTAASECRTHRFNYHPLNYDL